MSVAERDVLTSSRLKQENLVMIKEDIAVMNAGKMRRDEGRGNITGKSKQQSLNDTDSRRHCHGESKND